MRVVFLGTPGFAVPSLRALHSCTEPVCELVGVVTQPDRPAGRGQKLTPSPVKMLATEYGIPVFQPECLRSGDVAQKFVEQVNPHLMIVVAFGQILEPELFSYPPLGTLNVHASLLPKYRGAAPVVHALLNGEHETGVTIMKINEGMDTGAILSQSTVKVGSDTNAAELEKVLAHQGAELLIQTISGYATGAINPVFQNSEQVTYAPRIGKGDVRIDWSWDSLQIHNRVRALNPRPVATTNFRGKTVKIWRTSMVQEKVKDLDGCHSPGVILSLDRQKLLVACGGGCCVLIEELQMPNRRRISAGEFINGMTPEVGEAFT